MQESKEFRLNIHWQIILLLSAGIFSLAIIGSLTAGFFINNKVSDIVYDQAEQVTSSFAHLSILPLLSGVGDSATDDVESVLAYKNVHAVGIYKRDGELLVGSASLEEHGYLGSIEADYVPFKAMLVSESALFWNFLAPVYDSDFAATDTENIDSLFAPKPSLLGYVIVIIDRTSLFKTQQELLVNNLYISVGIALILIVIAALITHKLVKPLYHFVSLMEKAEEGDDSVRAEIKGPIEIDHMARGFNTMMQSLKQRREYAEQQHESLLAEINERVRAEAALKDSESHLKSVLLQNEAVVSTIPGIIIEFDANGKPLWWNKRAELITGLSEENFSNTQLTELVSEDCKNDVEQAIIYGIAMGSCELHAKILTIDGEVPYQLNGVKISPRGNDNATLLTIGMDDSESINAQIAMQAARDAALESSRVKSEFLANMSHEIRTPMNGMIGMLQLLADSNLNAEQNNFSNIALRSADQLLNVINDVLDFSKIEAGRLETHLTDFFLRELIEDVVELFAFNAYEKGIKIYSDMSFDVPEVINSDPQRLKQILSNLVGNAVKFTEKGHVRLKARIEPSGKNLVLSIIDTGIGIELDDQDKIFESFEQGDGSSTRKFNGTGLGLSIVKQLSELLGAGVELESVPDFGAEFKVVFPLSTISPELEFEDKPLQLKSTNHIFYLGNDRIQSSIFKSFSDHINQSYRLISEIEFRFFEPDEDDYIFLVDLGTLKALMSSALWRKIKKYKIYVLVCQHDYKIFEDINSKIDCELVKVLLPLRYKTFIEISQGATDEVSGVTSHDTTPPLGQSLQNSRVLVVEDNEVNQRVIMTMLSKLGHNAVLAENGKQCLDVLASNTQIELVIMDCQMPVMDGYTASRAVRNNAEQYNSNLKIIAMTGNALEGDKEKCIDAGMNDYLSKPIRLASLKTSIQKWLP